jgi:hypothetical protein
MKYFVLFGDYDYELELEQYDSERETLNRVIEIKGNYPADYKIHVIKGEKLEIVASYALKQGGGEK